jgi:hypothetical protein
MPRHFAIHVPTLLARACCILADAIHGIRIIMTEDEQETASSARLSQRELLTIALFSP